MEIFNESVKNFLRLKSEINFEKYKIRRSAENQLLRDYRGGLLTPNKFDPINGKVKPRNG